METPTPFDLNHAIQRWRENLAQSPAFRNEDLQELEAHLRDSIGALQARELSAEEAFLIAARRMGQDTSLEAEFSKVNRGNVWLDRILWTLIGVQVWGFISAWISFPIRAALSFGLIEAKYTAKSGLALPVTLFSVAQLAAVVATALICWWLFIRKGQKLGAWFSARITRRTTLEATAVAGCLLFATVPMLNYALIRLLLANSSMEVINTTVQSQGISNAILWPIQTIAMLAATLVLARKRLMPTSA